ncbi:P-loop NTPase fold protein [Amycolatopsis alkalitolerans]|uniref:KAP NTPase domain-containing protein n=1 Tax=Amycolatopsis alkalitolerans TaxID=2547244 RepID=A0A5C4LWX6_9PSEU|nr:P-loop NTPase fold protein [Amycolatopsis alkalitolerans]TNC22747.1 hypothetical protein FG385_24200 [Amycolatopsis alkalitolerans]
MTDQLTMDELAPAVDGVMRALASAELPPIVDEVLAQRKIQEFCEEQRLDRADLRSRLLADPGALLSPTNDRISAYRDAVRALGEVGPAGADRAWSSEYRAVLEFFLLLIGPAVVLGGAALLAAAYGGGTWLIAKIGLTLAVVVVGALLYLGLSIGWLFTITDRAWPPRSRPFGTRIACRIARWAAFLVTVVAVLGLWPSLVRHVTTPGTVIAAVLAVLTFAFAAAGASASPNKPSIAALHSGLRAEAEEALDRWREDARQAAELAVNSLISRLAAPSYEVRLTVRDDSGLGEMTSIARTLETASTQRFKRALSGMRSGAIGVAGPRGAGKTTLLEAHREKRLLPEGREHLVIRVDAPIGYEGRDFALHIYAVACQAVIDYRKAARSLRKRLFDRRTAEDKAWRMLVADADRRLEEIRFQLTTTTGWSGKFTLPKAAADFTASRSKARARQPLTYPEIIDELRKYLTTTARRLRETNRNIAATPVVVAIDELDKVASAEHAHRFVNELKALFGVPGCHFVLSVSEDALISFERRGFSVRDAFDSAFDEIIRLDYLTLPESREVLGRRVIGLPEPFVCFAHCFSGGLPRDLIRVARAMMDVAQTTPAPGLAQVCTALTGTAIEQAARLAQREVRPLGHVSSAVELVRLADGPDLARQRPEELLATVRKLAVMSEESEPLGAVRMELATFLYFALTMREVFDDTLSQNRIVGGSTDTGPGSFETLTRARQAFGDNTTQAWLLVDQFRQAWRLPVVELST